MEQKVLITEASMVSELKAYAQKSKVFDAVCHLWAFRKRARRQVTIAGLTYAMKKEGFSSYSKDDLMKILAFLASIGVGKLRNNGSSLSDVEISLKSLGLAAIGKDIPLNKIKPPVKKFRKLNVAAEVEKVHAKEIIETTPAVNTEREEGEKKVEKQSEKTVRTYPAFLTVLIEGRPLKFKAPDNITAENLTELLTRFREVSNEETSTSSSN